MLFVLSCSLSFAAFPQFDRLDLLSEERGMWLNYEVAGLTTYPTRAAVRWINQVKGVWHGPWPRSYIGISIASQSLVWEHPLPVSHLMLSTGLQSQMLLPNGITVGLAWRHKRLRIGFGISATSEATWSRIAYQYWSVLPTVGLGYELGQNK